MDKIATSSRLKQIMSERDLKQVDILKLAAPHCAELGVKINKSDLSGYVSGKFEPGNDKLLVLARALNVDPRWLMGIPGVPKNEAESAQLFRDHVMKPFNEQFLEKNKSEMNFEELRTVYARSRSKLTKEERMQLAAEILQDEEPKI